MAMSLELITIFFLFLIKKCQFSKYEPYNYCDPELKLCDNPTDHVMCKYPLDGLSERCNSTMGEPLSSQEKDTILLNHNRIRTKIASGNMNSPLGALPSASNMRQLYWDDELEILAAKWADQCVDGESEDVKDVCRNTRRFQVSQNVAIKGVNISDPKNKVEKTAVAMPFNWARELLLFDPGMIDNYTENEGEEVVAEDFTALIWADTYLIGCARIIFQQEITNEEEEEYEEEEYEDEEDEAVDEGKNRRKKQTEGSSKSLWAFERLVCNYGPRGNVIGKPVYKRGAPCEHCPDNTTCSKEFEALCRVKEIGNETSSDVASITEASTVDEENAEVNKTETVESEKPEEDLKSLPKEVPAKEGNTALGKSAEPAESEEIKPEKDEPVKEGNADVYETGEAEPDKKIPVKEEEAKATKAIEPAEPQKIEAPIEEGETPKLEAVEPAEPEKVEPKEDVLVKDGKTTKDKTVEPEKIEAEKEIPVKGKIPEPETEIPAEPKDVEPEVPATAGETTTVIIIETAEPEKLKPEKEPVKEGKVSAAETKEPAEPKEIEPVEVPVKDGETPKSEAVEPAEQEKQVPVEEEEAITPKKSEPEKELAVKDGKTPKIESVEHSEPKQEAPVIEGKVSTIETVKPPELKKVEADKVPGKGGNITAAETVEPIEPEEIETEEEAQVKEEKTTTVKTVEPLEPKKEEPVKVGKISTADTAEPEKVEAEEELPDKEQKATTVKTVESAKPERVKSGKKGSSKKGKGSRTRTKTKSKKVKQGKGEPIETVVDDKLGKVEPENEAPVKIENATRTKTVEPLGSGVEPEEETSVNEKNTTTLKTLEPAEPEKDEPTKTDEESEPAKPEKESPTEIVVDKEPDAKLGKDKPVEEEIGATNKTEVVESEEGEEIEQEGKGEDKVPLKEGNATIFKAVEPEEPNVEIPVKEGETTTVKLVEPVEPELVNPEAEEPPVEKGNATTNKTVEPEAPEIESEVEVPVKEGNATTNKTVESEKPGYESEEEEESVKDERTKPTTKTVDEKPEAEEEEEKEEEEKEFKKSEELTKTHYRVPIEETPVQSDGKAKPKFPDEEESNKPETTDEYEYENKPSVPNKNVTIPEGKEDKKNLTETGNDQDTQDTPWRFQTTTAQTPEGGASYLVKRGMFIEGVCRCSDLVRSGAEKRRSDMNKEAVFDPDVRRWVDRSGLVKREVPSLKDGDTCYCVKRQNGSSKLGIDKWIFSVYILFVYFIT